MGEANREYLAPLHLPKALFIGFCIPPKSILQTLTDLFHSFPEGSCHTTQWELLHRTPQVGPFLPSWSSASEGGSGFLEIV